MQKWEKKNPLPSREDWPIEEMYQSLRENWYFLRDQQAQRLVEIEMQDAEFQAYKKTVQDTRAAVIRQRVQEGKFEGPGMDRVEEMMKELKNKRGNGGSLHPVYFVTVNCKPDVILRELTKATATYVRRTMIRQAEWVFEQRGAHEGELGKGMHTHILVWQRGDIFDGVFKRNTRSTFKRLVGNPDTHVDIRPVKAEWIEDKRKYMQGAKTGEGKVEKVEMDRIWRRENNLQDYYTYSGSSPEKCESPDKILSENGDQAQSTPCPSEVQEDEEDRSTDSDRSTAEVSSESEAGCVFLQEVHHGSPDDSGECSEPSVSCELQLQLRTADGSSGVHQSVRSIHDYLRAGPMVSQGRSKRTGRRRRNVSKDVHHPGLRRRQSSPEPQRIARALSVFGAHYESEPSCDGRTSPSSVESGVQHRSGIRVCPEVEDMVGLQPTGDSPLRTEVRDRRPDQYELPSHD